MRMRANINIQARARGKTQKETIGRSLTGASPLSPEAIHPKKEIFGQNDLDAPAALVGRQRKDCILGDPARFQLNTVQSQKPGEEREFDFRQLKRFLVIFRNSSSLDSRFMLSTRSYTTCSPWTLRLIFSTASIERDPKNTPSSHQPDFMPKTARTYTAPCPCNQVTAISRSRFESPLK